jgi:hypothetical protein
MIATAFSVLNFAGGWIVDIFPDMSRSVDGQLMVMSSNGSRQLGASVLFVLAVATRNPHYAFAALLIRIVGEALDVLLFGPMMSGRNFETVIAATMLIWEIVALAQLWREALKN